MQTILFLAITIGAIILGNLLSKLIIELFLPKLSNPCKHCKGNVMINFYPENFIERCEHCKPEKDSK